jgi:hypothetical protein
MDLVRDQGAALEPLAHIGSKDNARAKGNGIGRDLGRRIYERAVKLTGEEA